MNGRALVYACVSSMIGPPRDGHAASVATPGNPNIQAYNDSYGRYDLKPRVKEAHVALA